MVPTAPPLVAAAELLKCLDALENGANPDDFEVLLSHAASRGLADDVSPELAQRLDDWVVASGGTRLADSRAATAEYDSEGETLPYTTIKQVETWAARHPGNIALAGFEFSASVRSDLEAMGYAAISADERPCEHGGHHFRGDVRPLLTALQWERALLFPPCHQHLRADLDCLEAKIKDGRAFWGAVLVLFCVVATTAKVLMVEQPDTIFGDAFDSGAWADVKVFEFRTAEYGDKPDKFVRLTTRNVATLPPPPYPDAHPPRLPRSHLDHANPDQRDRARSTWRPFENTRAALAAVEPAHPGLPPQIDYVAAAAVFAAWRPPDRVDTHVLQRRTELRCRSIVAANAARGSDC
jgi:hypothetical protein